MTSEESSFLLDIRVELSKAFTDEYEVTAKSENLFNVYLINIQKNNNKVLKKDNNTRIIQRQVKKKIPIYYPCGYNQYYGRSLLLTKTAAETISNMKKHYLEISLKSKRCSDGGNGAFFIPWTKSFLHYLKNITELPRLPPVTHRDKLSVVDPNNNKSLGSLNVTVKLMSLASNFYKFESHSKNNVRIYRNLFSSPKDLKKENSSFNEDRNHATDDNDTIVMNPCNNRSDTTYNINENSLLQVKTENTTDKKNISLENILVNANIQKTCRILCELEPTKDKGWKESDEHHDVSFKNRSFYVNYCTLNQNSKKKIAENSSNKNESPLKPITFQKYGDKSANSAVPVVNFKSLHYSDSKPDLSSVQVTSCHNITCDAKMRRSKLTVYDNSLALDFSTLHNRCCSSSSNLKLNEHPCYCTCECKFDFIRRTTYCKICGGYEIIGEEFVDTRGQEMPMPCPIFHKLVEKNKLKSRSSSGSIRRRKGDGSSRSIKSSKSTKSSTPKTSEKRLKVTEKRIVQQPVKESKKKKVVKVKQIDYSYKTPHAGHGDCTYPCKRSAILKCNVPKSMGWFWTADNVHGLKYRPTWRPGAAKKQVVNMLQMARHCKQIVNKKKKELAKAKRPWKRPLLVVHKKDGEFTVTMETMKASMKPREVYEHPYEDKPVLTYTIGRTDEENKEREEQKLRKRRRLEREQRTYIQSGFKNMCQEICLKTCQQALGILPEAEDNQGLCNANATWVEPENPNPSCACSEISLSVSDTDSDEWILEFTPPNAFFDPSRKGKNIIKTEKDTQYVAPQS